MSADPQPWHKDLPDYGTRIVVYPYYSVIQCNCLRTIRAFCVFYIRTGFNADLDPAFYLNTDSDSGSQNNADPCGSESGSWSEFAVTES